MTSILTFLKKINLNSQYSEKNTEENKEEENKKIEKDQMKAMLKMKTHIVIQNYINQHKSFLTEYLKFQNNILLNSEQLNQIIELYHRLLFDHCITIQKRIEKNYVYQQSYGMQQLEDDDLKIILKHIDAFNEIVLKLYELIELNIKIEDTKIPLIHNKSSILKHFRRIQKLLHNYLKTNGFKINIISL
jgi:hypothetical protein